MRLMKNVTDGINFVTDGTTSASFKIMLGNQNGHEINGEKTKTEHNLNVVNNLENLSISESLPRQAVTQRIYE